MAAQSRFGSCPRSDSLNPPFPCPFPWHPPRLHPVFESTAITSRRNAISAPPTSAQSKAVRKRKTRGVMKGPIYNSRIWKSLELRDGVRSCWEQASGDLLAVLSQVERDGSRDFAICGRFASGVWRCSLGPWRCSACLYRRSEGVSRCSAGSCLGSVLGSLEEPIEF